MGLAVRSLHLIVGPWASRQSTLVERLTDVLPEHVVFDWDLIIPGPSVTAGKDVFTDASTWDGMYDPDSGASFWIVGEIFLAVLAGCVRRVRRRRGHWSAAHEAQLWSMPAVR